MQGYDERRSTLCKAGQEHVLITMFPNTSTSDCEYLKMAVKKARTVSPDSKVEARNVIFFHPDLGIGGAERLVVDAAVGLQNRGHKVTIFTSHCDPRHCFDEARDGKMHVRSFIVLTNSTRNTRRTCPRKYYSSLLYPLTILDPLRHLAPSPSYILHLLHR